MENLDDIVAGIPMNALADQLGVDPTTAESAVRQALPALLGGGRVDLIKKLLPLLAPIVLSYLSSRMRGGTTTGTEAPPSGGIGDLLGSILGSTGTGGSSTSAGPVLDMLGGLL